MLCAPDHGFFTARVSAASTSAPPPVTTRMVTVRVSPPKPPPKPYIPHSSPPQFSKSSTPSPLSSPPTSSPVSSPPQKRKSTSLGSLPDETESSLPREVKRLRADKPRKRAVSTSKLAARASSQLKALPPSPEPIYRSSRSRSTSHFTAIDNETPVIRRRWAAEEDGGPDPAHFSSEKAVAMLLRTYCACACHLLKSASMSCDLAFRLQKPRGPVRSKL